MAEAPCCRGCDRVWPNGIVCDGLCAKKEILHRYREHMHHKNCSGDT